MRLSQPVKFYIGFIITTGFALLALSVFKSDIHGNGAVMVAAAYFLVLGAIAESLPVRIDGENLVSISSTVSIASILLFDIHTAVIIRFLGAILAVRKNKARYTHLFNTPIYKTLFNGFGRGITVFLAGLTYRSLSNLISEPSFIGFNVLGLLGIMPVYFAVDTLLFSILFSQLSKVKLRDEIENKLWTITYLILLSPIGVLLAGLYNWQGIFPIILFWGPFLFARQAFEQSVQTKQTFQETILAFSLAVEAKDPYTNGHSHRVAEIAIGIANQMRMRKTNIEILRSAAILHDIGKIGVSDSTLNKSAILSPNELMEVRKHAVIGANIINQVSQLKPVMRIVRYHHVYYNGTGYPEVPEGDDVPIEAHILAVADAFDAMTTDRSYRKALSNEDAKQQLKEGAGTQFHPDVVNAFMVYLNNKKADL